MTFLHRERTAELEARKYASTQDLRKVSSEQMDNVPLLAFLLTAKHEKAAKCIVSAIAESWLAQRP